RRTPRRHQRRSDPHRGVLFVLQPVQRLEQRLEWPGGQRLQRVDRLVRRERIEPIALIDALGLVGEQHRVAVEGDAQLVGMPSRSNTRFSSAKSNGAREEIATTSFPSTE